MTNRMLTCWIIDDEPLALDLLKTYIDEIPFLRLTGSYLNPSRAMEDILSKSVDLIFLDIQMPKINGMELAQLIPACTKIVFITAFREYALEGYKVNAFDYLLKPVSFEEFQATCNKALDWFETVSGTTSEIGNVADKNVVFVKTDHQIIPLPFRDILYIEGLKDYVKIYTINRERPYITLESMKKMEQLLPDSLFIRVHRSFIVQKNKINSLSKTHLTVMDRKIPIGKTYKRDVQNFIGTHSVG